MVVEYHGGSTRACGLRRPTFSSGDWRTHTHTYARYTQRQRGVSYDANANPMVQPHEALRIGSTATRCSSVSRVLATSTIVREETAVHWTTYTLVPASTHERPLCRLAAALNSPPTAFDEFRGSRQLRRLSVWLSVAHPGLMNYRRLWWWRNLARAGPTLLESHSRRRRHCMGDHASSPRRRRHLARDRKRRVVRS